MVRLTFQKYIVGKLIRSLRAAAYVFQKPGITSDPEDRRMFDSTVQSYLGLDKREGLVAMGKRLVGSEYIVAHEAICH